MLHSPSEAYTTTAAKINSSDIGYIAKYINEQNKSSDKKKEIEVFESLDYEPFVAKFRKYKPGLTQVEKENVLVRGLINLRANPHLSSFIILLTSTVTQQQKRKNWQNLGTTMIKKLL